MPDHVCPVCNLKSECIIVSQGVPHKCPKCGTEWLENEKGGHLIL